MKNEVNAELYDFLQEHETGMYAIDNELVAYVHIPFYALDEFTKIVDNSTFDEGGLIVRMFDNTICVDLNDIIEYQGHEILSYQKCFDESDIKRYMPELVARIA